MKKWSALAFIAAVCALAVPHAARAELSYGLLGGIGAARFHGENAGEYQAVFSFSAGGFLEIPIRERLLFHPEMLFTFKGGEEKGSDVQLSLFYVEFPLLFRYTLPIEQLPFQASVFAGPDPGLDLSAVRRDSVSESIGSRIEDVDFSLVLGAGIDYRDLLIDARYTWGLTDVSKSPSRELRNAVFSIMFGYRLQ